MLLCGLMSFLFNMTLYYADYLAVSFAVVNNVIARYIKRVLISDVLMFFASYLLLSDAS